MDGDYLVHVIRSWIYRNPLSGRAFYIFSKGRRRRTTTKRAHLAHWHLDGDGLGHVMCKLVVYRDRSSLSPVSVAHEQVAEELHVERQRIGSGRARRQRGDDIVRRLARADERRLVRPGHVVAPHDLVDPGAPVFRIAECPRNRF